MFKINMPHWAQSPQNAARTLAMCTAALVLSCVAFAQSNNSIKIIVPFTPGTGMDTIARAISPHLSERMGVPVEAY